MKTAVTYLEKPDEIQRLQRLIPADFECRVEVTQTIAISPPIVETKQLDKRHFVIQIDLIQWQSLTLDQCNLLFWSEIARIRNRGVPQNRAEFIVLGAGLGTALLDTAMQNVVLLTGSLLVAGLAGFQLYQRNQGERRQRRSSAADQDAMTLATQFGYTRSAAYRHLHSALGQLARASSKRQRARYEARQNVLEIYARTHDVSTNSHSTITGDRASHPRPKLSLQPLGRPQASAAAERHFHF